MLLLCTSGLESITTNICKTYSAYKKGISYIQETPFFHRIGFSPITIYSSFRIFRFFQNQCIIIDNPIIRIVQLQCHRFIIAAYQRMNTVFSIFIGLGSGYYPANKAVQVPALEAIKSD